MQVGRRQKPQSLIFAPVGGSPMYVAAGFITTLLIVGGVASAMGAEDGAGHKIRPAANLAVNQATEDPRVKTHEIISEQGVEQACDTGPNGWCQKAQQQHQLVALLFPLVLGAASISLFLKPK